MPIRSILRAFILVCPLAVLIAGPAGAADSPRLGDHVAPTFQAIELHLDADRPDYRGTVRIELTVKQTTRRFVLHSEGPELHSLSLAGADGEIAVTHAPEGADRVAIRSAAPLAPGNYTLTISFTNLFDTTAVSLYRAQVDGLGYAFINSSPMRPGKPSRAGISPSSRFPFR